jgi:photosystem II stability/assembly factor-like uncharacterized protein
MRTRISRELLVLIASLTLLVPSRAEELPLAEVSHIHGIGFDPSKPGSVLLATHYGIYRANPDGVAETVSADANDYMGFSPDPADAGRLLASGHPGQGGSMGVILSTDGGVTWQKIADGVGGPVDFHAMTVSRVDPRVIYGVYGGIQASGDGGMSWTIAGPGPDRVIDLAASPIDTDTVYAGTMGGLMRSVDAGKTWALVGPPGRAATLVETTADGSLYAFLGGAGLFKLNEGDWTELATDFGERYLLHLAGDPADAAHLVAVTDESVVLESRDGGKTWQGFGQ